MENSVVEEAIFATQKCFMWYCVCHIAYPKKSSFFTWASQNKDNYPTKEIDHWLCFL